MSKKRILSLVLAMAMTVSLFAGCGGSSSSSAAAEGDSPAAADGSSTAAASGETIKIGYVSDLTGTSRLWGTAGRDGALLAVEDVNAAGGVLDGQMIELIASDGKGEPADSVNAYRSMVENDGIVASIGTNFSNCNIAMAPVAEQLQVPIVGTATSNSLVTMDEEGNLRPYSFRMCFLDSFQGTALGLKAAQLGFTKGAMIRTIDDTYSMEVGQYIMDTFVEQGGEIVASETVNVSDTDFRAQLTNIAAANPDVLFIPCTYNNVALIAKQAKEMGINCVYMGTDSWDSAELAELAGGALEGSYYVSRIGFNSPEAKEFGERYQSVYNVDLEAECLFGYSGVMWIVDAIERAGSADPTAIRDALENTDTFSSLIGTLVQDPATHNPSMDVAVFQCTDGVFNYVETMSATDISAAIPEVTAEA